MKNLINETKFYKKYQVKRTIVEFEKDAIEEHISDYLKNNKINDEQYSLDCIEIDYSSMTIEVSLQRIEGYAAYQIDEDFTDDVEWRIFCSDLADELGVRRLSVPYWYYAK